MPEFCSWNMSLRAERKLLTSLSSSVKHGNGRQYTTLLQRQLQRLVITKMMKLNVLELEATSKQELRHLIIREKVQSYLRTIHTFYYFHRQLINWYPERIVMKGKHSRTAIVFLLLNKLIGFSISAIIIMIMIMTPS